MMMTREPNARERKIIDGALADYYRRLDLLADNPPDTLAETVDIARDIRECLQLRLAAVQAVPTLAGYRIVVSTTLPLLQNLAE